MHVHEAIQKRRSIRKFAQKSVNHEYLVTLVDQARMAASAANQQPLKYAVLDDHKLLEKIFPCVKWAGYLPEWNPTPTEAPPAYIAVFGDTALKNSFEVDAGAAITTMMLSAVEMGLATCWLGAIDRAALAGLLGFDSSLHLLYLLAVGYPDQKGKPCPMESNDCKYFFDERGTLCVPKRGLSSILITLPQ